MAGRGKTFFAQYDREGRAFLRAQRSSPLRDHRRAFRIQLTVPLKEKKVLDAGCGYGHDLPCYATRGATVYGTDPSMAMIAWPGSSVRMSRPAFPFSRSGRPPSTTGSSIW